MMNAGYRDGMTRVLLCQCEMQQITHEGKTVALCVGFPTQQVTCGNYLIPKGRSGQIGREERISKNISTAEKDNVVAQEFGQVLHLCLAPKVRKPSS
jgi:hypothetical protein